MKRLLTLVLIAALLIPAAAASAEVVTNKAGVFPITSEPIYLTAWLEGGTDKDWENNGWLQETAEKTNVHVTIIPSPSADALQKRNILLASGEFPDIFLTNWSAIFNKSDVMQFGVKEGILVNIEPFIEEYSTELRRVFEYNDVFRITSTSPDGAIYGVPRFSECYHCMAYPKVYIRQDWLDKLNLEMPTTTEEFRAVLKAFVEGDPNGNGKADEIGLTGATTWNTMVEYALLGWSYLPVKPDFWLYLEDGEVKFAPDKEAYREGLRYVKSLYDEGLIDKAAFSQKEDIMAQTIRQDPPIVGAYVCDHVAMGVQNTNREEYMNATVMIPLKGPDGFQRQPQNANEGEVQGFMGVITDTCKYPEAAFRWLDYQLSEYVTVVKQWGKEGVGWVYAPEGTVDIFGNPANYLRLDATEKNPEAKKENDAYGFGSGPQADLAPLRLSMLPAVEDLYDPANYEQRIALDTQPLLEFVAEERLPATLFVDIEVSDEFNEIKTNLKDFVRKATVQFIIGDRDLDTGWDAYKDELRRFGADRYLEIYTKTYQEAMVQ